MIITRTFPIIFAHDVTAVRDFYVGLFEFEAAFDCDWFCNLQAPGNAAAELGIWARDHELVPEGIRQLTTGGVINLVVEDVDRVFADATRRGLPMILEPRNEPYGQRRFVTKDPVGTILDVSSPIEMSPDYFVEDE